MSKYIFCADNVAKFETYLKVTFHELIFNTTNRCMKKKINPFNLPLVITFYETIFFRQHVCYCVKILLMICRLKSLPSCHILGDKWDTWFRKLFQKTWNALVNTESSLCQQGRMKFPRQKDLFLRSYNQLCNKAMFDKQGKNCFIGLKNTKQLSSVSDLA